MNEIGDVVFLEIAQDEAVRPVVPIAGRVGEQLTRGDRPPGGPELRRPVELEALEHLHGCELRQDVACRFIKIKSSLLDELHGARGHERLGHRGVPEDRVDRHRLGSAHALRPGCALIERAAFVHRHRHYAGRSAGLTRSSRTRSIRSLMPMGSLPLSACRLRELAKASFSLLPRSVRSRHFRRDGRTRRVKGDGEVRDRSLRECHSERGSGSNMGRYDAALMQKGACISRFEGLLKHGASRRFCRRQNEIAD